jgi:general secretion pathway protein A
MYEEFYGLKERPFDLSPNPRFLFLTKGHREALTHLSYALTGRPGVTVLVGEAGTGKTTIIKAALNDQSSIVHLSNPTLSKDEFFDFLAAGFGFGPEAARSKTVFLRRLEERLQTPDSPTMAVIVDEAQSVSHELLEEVRLLTNTEAPNGRSLTVALVGQPELSDRLNHPSLRQLKQRIALRCTLNTLTLAETASYISARVRVAGGREDVMFTRDAVRAIHEHSKGIPRTVSVICDNALISGFAADVKPVNRDMILEVCKDFELVAPSAPAAPALKLAEARPNESRTERVSLPEPVESGDRQPMFSGVSRRPRRFSFF